MGDETSASSVDPTTVVTTTSSLPMADASLSGPAGNKGTPQVSGGEGHPFTTLNFRVRVG